MWPLFPRTPKGVRPPDVPTDTIIPLNRNDDTPANRSVIIDVALRFDDVLDADKLSDALGRLISMGNWRKLGARLRLDEKTGKLEYHVPASFSKERPAFVYTHDRYGMSIEEEPVTSKLPKATPDLSVYTDHRLFEPYIHDPKSPAFIEDFIYTDAPQISLHIASFTDATLVTFSWGHWLTDAMGVATIFDAWKLVLNGREDEVPELIGFDYDPLEELGVAPKEEYLLSNIKLEGLRLFIFGARYMYEYIWGRYITKDANRTVCIPAAKFTSIKEATLKEVESTKTFLSDGDVLLSWFSRFVLHGMPWTKGRTVGILNAFSIRPLLTPTLLPRNKAYPANAVAAVYAFLPVDDVLSKPVSHTAQALRKAIVDQGTRDQMEAYMHILRSGPFVMGDLSSVILSYSNWSKSNFYGTDFSSVVLKEGVPLDKRANLLGRPSYMFSIGHSRDYYRDCAVILGKDPAGNMWLSGTFGSGAWVKIEEALQKV